MFVNVELKKDDGYIQKWTRTAYAEINLSKENPND